MSFKPKRIVSPVYIQILTAGIATLILVDYTIRTTPEISPYQLALFGFIVFGIFSYLLGVLGFVQALIVRWFIGLNGTSDSVDKKTYPFDIDFDDLSKFLLEKSFLDSWDLLKRKKGENVVIRSPYLVPLQIRLALSRDNKNSNRSIIATVAYEKKFYSILTSDTATAMRNDMIRRIEDNFKVKANDIGLDNSASTLALKSGLYVTETKFVSVWNVPKTFLLTISLTVLALLVMTLMYFQFRWITQDLYGSSIIIIFIALLFEFAPLLRESISNRRGE